MNTLPFTKRAPGDELSAVQEISDFWLSLHTLDWFNPLSLKEYEHPFKIKSLVDNSPLFESLLGYFTPEDTLLRRFSIAAEDVNTGDYYIFD